MSVPSDHLPFAHGPRASLIVPLSKKLRRVKLVTSTGTPPAARICPTMKVKFAPIDSGGACGIVGLAVSQKCPSWMRLSRTHNLHVIVSELYGDECSATLRDLALNEG